MSGHGITWRGTERRLIVIEPVVKSWHSSGPKIRSALKRAAFKAGFRYRNDDETLPGVPHLVFPKYRTAAFACSCILAPADHPCVEKHLKGYPYGIRSHAYHRHRFELVIAALEKHQYRVATFFDCEANDEARLLQKLKHHLSPPPEPQGRP